MRVRHVAHEQHLSAVRLFDTEDDARLTLRYKATKFNAPNSATHATLFVVSSEGIDGTMHFRGPSNRIAARRAGDVVEKIVEAVRSRLRPLLPAWGGHLASGAPPSRSKLGELLVGPSPHLLTAEDTSSVTVGLGPCHNPLIVDLLVQIVGSDSLLIVGSDSLLGHRSVRLVRDCHWNLQAEDRGY